MATWRVFKAEDVNRWNEAGSYEAEPLYTLGYDAPQKLGSKFGPGSYLLLNAEGNRYEEIEVGSRQEFFKIETDAEDVPEAVTA